ncbi:MAG: type II toxin-antitoxin system HicB family antitoxin [Bryobacterales bacterium]|nr:type II toxin-antitoxin system HicB family antitoxin [Bryobacterales bacterium]MBV9400406.1 type II toxin-antitoxin system HicB family antitoxin [Bryobacterales bacterium]
MTNKVSVVIEQDEHGCYAWCPELKGCQSQGKTIEEALENIREAIELYLETLSDEERLAAFSKERPLLPQSRCMPTTLHPKIVKQVLEAIEETR